MEKTPEISVIIPTYNEGKLLLRAIRSVLFQTFTDYEILIVDDGSEEDYAPFIETLGLDNMYYFRLPHRNANVARNHGIRQSKGNYIAMLDADDEWLKHHLEANIGIMGQQTCDGIYSSVLAKSSIDERVFQARPRYEGEKMVNYLLSTGVGAQTSTLFMRADAAKKVIWDESLNRHQDYDFVVRFDKKFKWLANPEASAVYHLENGTGCLIDFESCIRFIEKNKADISPVILKAYHKKMLRLAIAQRCENDIINYYTRKSSGSTGVNLVCK